MTNRPLDVLLVAGGDTAALVRCLDGVRAHLEGATVRVHVGPSVADAVRATAEARPDLDWVFADDELGYAAAVNRLVARGSEVGGADTLLLRDDVELRGPLAATRAALGGERVAAVSPPVADIGDTGWVRPWDVARRRQTVPRVLLEHSGYAPRLRGRRSSDLYAAAPTEVDGYLVHVCLLVARAAWEDVGLLDERFLRQGEDREWQRRARDRGWRLLLAPGADADPEARRPGGGHVVLPRLASDPKLASTALALGVDGNGGRAMVAVGGGLVLERLQRSKRRPRRDRPVSALPSVVITTPRLGIGGAERQRMLLANELHRRGHDVTVVCLRDVGHLQRDLHPGVRLVLRPFWQPVLDTLGDQTVLVSGTTNIEVAFAAVWARLTPTRGTRRWLVAAHGIPGDEPGQTFSPRLITLIERCDAVVALSEAHWRDFTAVRPTRMRHFCVPNGVDPHPDRGYAPHTPLRLGFLGRLVESKNVQVLIAALARFPERAWRLDVFGGGRDEQMLRDGVPDAVRDRVQWHGRTAGPEPALAAVDVLCLPSRREVFPLVLLEAMAHGIPVMASAVCAVPELLDEGEAGIVVPEATEDAWAAALEPVLADPGSLTGLARVGWERMNALYTVDAMVDGYQRIIAEVLAEPRRRSRHDAAVSIGP